MKPLALRCTLCVGLLLAVCHGAAACAADDVVDGPPAPVAARQPQPDPAPTAGDEDAVGGFVVTLANGDRITGALVALDESSLRVKPDFAAAAAIEVPMEQVDGVGREDQPNPFEARGDRLYPCVGGVIHGTLVGIDAQGITVDAQLIGKVTLPLEMVSAFVREGVEQPERVAAARFHEVHDASGSRLVGHVEFTPAGLTVTTEGLVATVALRHVDVILFPTDRPAADAEGDRKPRCTIELANGSEIIGGSPRLEKDRIVVGLGETSVPVPLNHVARLWVGSESGPAGGQRRVVFWSKFSDAQTEAAHMAEALREGLPRGWDVDAEGNFTAAAEIGEALRTAGVLVVPEMESFDADTAPDAVELGRVIRGFLNRGGTVVVAGVDDSTAPYWGETGLFTIESADRSDDASFTFVRGHRLGQDAGESFDAVNGTSAYETDDAELEPVARQRDGAAAVLVKKVGRGSIVILGMDYFERSEAIDRVLVNAVTRSRGH